MPPVDDERARDALQAVIPQVEQALGGPVVNVVESIAGTAPGWRLRVDVAGRGLVFLKASDGSEWADEAIGGEVALITTVRHRHMPPVLASEPTAAVPWMVQPDLAGAAWPPPWPDLPAVFTAARRLGRTTPPQWLPRTEDVDPWADLEDEPHTSLLSTAASRVSLAGNRLVHGDLGAGNLCLARGQVVVVDWSDAYVGNPEVDQVSIAIDAAHAGGGRVLPPVADPAAWLAKAAGLLLAAAARPPWDGDGGLQVRRQQAALARTAVAWAVDLVGAG